MNEKILVTYATRAGSTAGVAEAVTNAFRAAGAHVDLLPVQDVRSVAPYRAVVAGSAIQSGAWLPEALDFVHRERAALIQRPFAAFLVCMTLAMPGKDYRAHVATWLDPVGSLVPPVSEGLFPGVLDIPKIPSFGDRLKFRISVMLGVWPEGDRRDWEAVRAWAERTYPLLMR